MLAISPDQLSFYLQSLQVNYILSQLDKSSQSILPKEIGSKIEALFHLLRVQTCWISFFFGSSIYLTTW